MSTYTRIFVDFLIRHVEMHIIIERLGAGIFIMFFLSMYVVTWETL